MKFTFNRSFTVRSGTTRAQQRMMAKLFSARSGIDFLLSLMDRWAEPSAHISAIAHYDRSACAHRSLGFQQFPAAVVRGH